MTICKCDPDAELKPDAEHPSFGGDQTWNTRAHIKQVLDGHWPLTDAEDSVECELCGGQIKRTKDHKAALNREPLR